MEKGWTNTSIINIFHRDKAIRRSKDSRRLDLDIGRF